MIDDLLDIRIFVSVAGAGSLSSAAKNLDMSLAAVSKRLAGLERRLGLVLMSRTTRSQSLTAEGTVFLAGCKRILHEVSEAEAFITDSQKTIEGLLTLAAPPIFGTRYLVPLVSEFQANHPGLDIKLVLGDEGGDVVGQGIDLCFRFTPVGDSTLSAKAIAPSYSLLCASPDYLRRHGIPRSVPDLAHHACIVRGNRADQQWDLVVGGLLRPVAIRAKFVVNSAEAAQTLAQGGAGIHLACVWDVANELAAGLLVPVMPECLVHAQPMQAVFPHGRQIAPRVRHFLDLATERLRAVDISSRVKVGGELLQVA